MKTDHDNIELFILNQAIKNSNSKKEIQEIKNELYRHRKKNWKSNIKI